MVSEGQKPLSRIGLGPDGGLMPLYIRLASLTDQAVKNVHNIDTMLQGAKKVYESHGCKIVQSWSTLGPYDIVAVIEGPDDKTVMTASAKVAKEGNFRATTMPAVPMSEFAASLH